MGKHEVEVKAELGILPKVVVGYKVTWERRAAEYSDQVQQAASLTEEELESRCVTSEALTDMFVHGARRAAEVSDGPYRNALARLVGAALHDDARIDELGLLQSQLLQLEPIHLRLLNELASTPTTPSEKGETVSLAGDSFAHLGLSVAALAACLDRLAAVGFARSVMVTWAQFDGTTPLDWQVTDWGLQALRSVGAQGSTPFT